MGIFDVFSKREKRQKEMPSVYAYDILSSKVRIQIVRILDDLSGEDHYVAHDSSTLFETVHSILCDEIGVLRLEQLRHNMYKEAVLNFILQENTTEYVIDAIEVTVRTIEEMIESRNGWAFQTAKIKPNDAIHQINFRFRENGIGFQYENGRIIKLDNSFSHSQIIRPVLQLLSDKKFAGPCEEFQKAFDHYSNGRNKECIAECLKAFESTMKVICKEKKWNFDKNFTAKKLIDVCLKNGLVPALLQTQLTNVTQLFESGIPALRNNMGGHGQGNVIQVVDDRIARYAINLTASNILFFVEQSGLR